MQNLLKAKSTACTEDWQAKRRSDLGEKFRSLSAEEQRRHAMRLIEKADEYSPRKLLRLSILVDRRFPPDIEHHRQHKNQYAVSFYDREAATAWITRAYGLGFDVFHHQHGGGAGLGHPCEADGES